MKQSLSLTATKIIEINKLANRERVFNAFAALLQAIDAGEVKPTENEFLACAIVAEHYGLIKLVFEFAKRSEIGTETLLSMGLERPQ